MKTYTGWHFSGPTLRDGSPLPRKGDILTLDGKVKMCWRGYHASIRAIDALGYAPGAMVCRVRLYNATVGGDKAVALKRKNLTDYVDATRTLHLFACDVAETALADAGVTDKRSHNAITTKRLWLDGKATDERLDAAWDAAWDAARAAAWAAAGDAQNVELERRLRELLK